MTDFPLAKKTRLPRSVRTDTAIVSGPMAAAEAPVAEDVVAGGIVAAQPVAAEPVAAEPVTPPESDVGEMIEAVASPAVQSDPTPAEASAPAPTLEEPVQMATITNTPAESADKMQALFGDMSTRFKAALEKSQKMGEELVELTKGNIEAMVASARVAAKGGETLGQEAAEYGRKSVEGAIAAMKGMASVKSPTELFQLQSDYAKSSFDSAIAEASRLSESMLRIAGEAAQPLSSRYAVAAEKIKAASL